ncbi:cytochrome P450 [Pseudonocardia sp. GCM10023141]|uniref:cytochrome P450 n=1 Tax=Pseudonocardia sp. GCM10023141 TaxID=3252653 RepID=UPI00360FB7B0
MTTTAPHRLPAGMDPFRPENLADPYPYYAQLRALGPATYLPERDAWFVATYDSVSQVLRNYREFVSGLGSSYHRVAESGFRFPFIDNDPPEHTRIRRSVQGHFGKGPMAELATAVRADIAQLAEAALATGTVDVVTALAQPIPDLTIARVTGIPSPGTQRMAAWADAAFHVVGPEPDPAHLQLIMESLGWLGNEGLTGMPAHCLGRMMMEQGGDNGLLAAEGTERLFAIASIWVAGVDTTNSLISNMIHAFTLFPEQWEILRADPSLIPAAVEEVLRWDSPVRVFVRRTLEDVELQGVTIPADSDVCALFPAANRDPDAFDDADTFDITAPRAKMHLAFGASIHLCLGAPVARLEAATLLEHLVERVVRFEAAGEARRGISRTVRNFAALPTRFVTT